MRKEIKKKKFKKNFSPGKRRGYLPKVSTATFIIIKYEGKRFSHVTSPSKFESNVHKREFVNYMKTIKTKTF